jgi:hypothetical protein
MKIRLALVCIVASLTSACAWFNSDASIDESIQATVTGTDQAVQLFLAGRDLDTIEGAWKHDANAFEIVISKNNFNIAAGYDYVGVITRSDQTTWEQGDVKVLLRNTDSADVFEGVWMTRYKSATKMTFVLDHENLIQANYVSNDGNSNFVRIRRISPRFARAQ